MSQFDLKDFGGDPGVPADALELTVYNKGGKLFTVNKAGTVTDHTAPGGSSLPVDDTTALVKGSGDPTKLVRIEADGITTGTTRVLTMPDADITPDDVSGTRTPSPLSVTDAQVAVGAAIAESKLALSFATHDSANDPTADESDALAGTDGAPSAINLYVTDSDPRLIGGAASGLKNFVDQEIAATTVNFTAILIVGAQIVVIVDPADAGLYKLHWEWEWRYSQGNRDFRGRPELDGIAVVDPTGAGEHRQEPKDTGGNQRYMTQCEVTRSLAAGPHVMNFLFGPQQAGDTATISRTYLYLHQVD